MPRPDSGESTLRRIWLHQAFVSLPLRTEDGAKIAVRFPGEPNGDGGPDFLDARIRIGRVLCRGDVELHARSSSWHAHGHDADPHYNRVILHAVLRNGRKPPLTRAGRAVPQVVLAPHIDAKRFLPRAARGGEQCRLAGMRLPQDPLRALLRSFGRRKIDARVRALSARLVQIGGEGHADSWDQLLYECLMEGMGYAKNRTPFLALARRVPLDRLLRAARGDAHAAEALLFGEAGLLPPARAVAEKEARGYVRCQRRRWKRLRQAAGRGEMREADWKFFRLRPVNFPTARLAGFCRLLPLFSPGKGLERLLAPVEHPGATPGDALRSVASLLAVHGEGFWSRHLCFRGRGGCIALGAERTSDLIVNAVVPLAMLRARVMGTGPPGGRGGALLDALPGVPRSASLREMGARLGGAASSGRLAAEGALRLRALYCARSRCRVCPALRTSRRRSRGRTWRS